MKNLKHKAVSGVKWQLVNKVGQKVFSVVTFIILARILEPVVFGLFSMAFVAIDGIQLFRTFGLDSALVQRKTDVERAANTAFFIVTLLSAVISLTCYAVAPLVGHFFKNTEVVDIIRGLSIIFVISGMSKIPSTLLYRQMKFNLMAQIEVLASLFNIVCVVVLALISPTVWSLVIAYIIRQVIICVLTWSFSDFRPKFEFDKKIAGELMHFGKFMAGLSGLWYLSYNLPNMVIGRILGAVSLGYYNLARNIGNFINTHFTALISGVLFPTYSLIQDDKAAMKAAYLKTIKIVSMLAMPFGMGLILMSEELVFALYGEKWAPIIPLMQIFGAVQLFTPVIACAGALFLGCGKPKYNFLISLVGIGVSLPCFIIFSSKWGIVGAAFVNVITSTVTIPVYLMLLKKIIEFRYREVYQAIAPSLYCTLFMCVGIILSKTFLQFDFITNEFLFYIMRVCVTGLIAAGIYAVSFYRIDKKTALEIFGMLFKPKAV